MPKLRRDTHGMNTQKEEEEGRSPVDFFGGEGERLSLAEVSDLLAGRPRRSHARSRRTAVQQRLICVIPAGRSHRGCRRLRKMHGIGTSAE